MTSSIKPEVLHNLSQHCQRRTESWAQATCTENLLKFDDCFQYVRANRQTCWRTDRHTYHNIPLSWSVGTTKVVGKCQMIENRKKLRTCRLALWSLRRSCTTRSGSSSGFSLGTGTRPFRPRPFAGPSTAPWWSHRLNNINVSKRNTGSHRTLLLIHSSKAVQFKRKQIHKKT